MTADNLDVRLLSFRARRDESPTELAIALLAAGRFPEALEVVRVGLLDAEDDCALLVLGGRAWFEQGDLHQAQTVLLSAVKAHPQEKEPYRWLAQVLMKRGEPMRAVQVLDRVLRLDPHDRTLQQVRARAERLARISSEADAPEPVAAAVLAVPVAQSVSLGAAAPAPAENAERAPLPAPLPAPRIPKLDEPVRGSKQPPGVVAPPPRPSGRSLFPSRAKVPERKAERPSLEVIPEPTGPFHLESEEFDEIDAFDVPTARDQFAPPRRSTRPSDDEDDDDFARTTAPPAPTAPIASSPTIEIADDIGVPDYGHNPLFDGVRPSSYATTDPTERNDAIQPTVDRAETPEAETPEAVLGMLRDQGVFEPTQRRGEDWVTKREAPRAGNRLGKSLAVTWTLALLTAGGGYYGWTRFLEMRRADARALIAQAVAGAHDGDHERLVAAERKLIQARQLDPRSDVAIEELLFVHAARALEDSAGEIGYLRATIARAERAGASKGLLLAAKALLYTYDRNPAAARAETEASLKAGPNDARVLYLVGRLHQRMGVADAEALLSQASQTNPELSLAWLGQGEIARQMGRQDEALQLFEQARGKDHSQLRAELWTIMLETNAESAPRELQKLDALKKRIEHGAPADKLLALLARVGALLDSGDLAGAGATIKQASQIVVQDPELLSLLADRAASAGEHDLAYRAANAAMLTAPGNRRYRDALANVLLKRGDGRAVLAALQGLDDESPWMLLMRARAALLSGSREAAEEAKRTLSAHRQSDAGKDDLDAAALLVRLDLRLGANAESLMAAARTLSQKAKDSPLAQAALGEALVVAGQGDAAVEVLEQARKLGSDDADVHYLLGRAYRLQGNVTGAKASLERALLVAPSHVNARETLGSLLLDSGDYTAAEVVFTQLERDRAGTSATLGIAEALLGRGDVEAAKQRLIALPADKKDMPSVQASLARVAIADHRAGEAVKMIGPLVAEDSELRTADMLVLYGDALYANGAVDTAAGVYDDALELDATHPDALVGRAMAALRAEKLPQVYELLTAAEEALRTRVRPRVVRATLLFTRARARMLQKQFDAAKTDLAEATKAPGIAPEAFFWYAEALAKTKNGGAAEQYAKYLELDPKGEYAARAKKALAPR